MTGHTTDAGIALVPSAIEYSVGLKTDVAEPGLPWHDHHLIEAAVARAAEFLTQFVRFHLPGIKNVQFSELVHLDRRDMFLARTMTAFTGHPWD